MPKAEIRDYVFKRQHTEYKEIPFLTFSAFIDDCLKVGEDIYPEVRAEGDEIVRRYWELGINEAILNWGIGSGKSLLAALMTLYFTHILLCYKDPHKHFKILNDKPIATINMGTSATQARNVVFTSMVNMISVSEWFQQFAYEPLGTEIRFFKHGIKNAKHHRQKPYISAYCGNSKETTPLGYNIFCAVLDEFAFYLDNDSKNIAMDIYAIIKNRITSRFGQAGFVLPISSSRYEGDAIDTLYEKNKNKKDIYCTRKKTWEVKDPTKMSAKTFEFVARRDENNAPADIWTIPIDFQKAFAENAEKAMRDFGCKPSLALEPFDRDGGVIKRNVNRERQHPIMQDGKFAPWFKSEKDARWRYMHIDLGLKKDACGIAMATQNGVEIVDGEKRPKVYVDFMLRIKAQKGGEILFSDVRQIIYDVKAMGYWIKKVTFDGWQSADSIQILKQKGIPAELLSVDRTTEAYDTLKGVLHNNGLDYYHYVSRNDKGEDEAIFEREYMSLELIKAKKVDHPENGSKDVADAVAGATLAVVQNASGGVGIY